MRSDRKEGRRRSKAAEKSNNKIYRIIALVYSVIMVLFVALLTWLNILPMKYLVAVIAVLALISDTAQMTVWFTYQNAENTALVNLHQYVQYS